MKRLRIVAKLAHACLLYPELRIGQIIANAVGRHSAANTERMYYLDDDTLLHVLTEYNKEAL